MDEQQLTRHIDEAVELVWEYHHVEEEFRVDEEFKRDLDGILVFCSSDVSVADSAVDLWWETAQLRKAANENAELPYLAFSGGIGTGMHSGANLLGWKKTEAEVLGERARDRLASLNANLNPTIFIENKAANSGENTDFTKAILDAQGAKTQNMVVVQKPFMERRTLATFKRRWPEPNIRIHSASISWESYPAAAGISREDITGIMIGDLQRIKLYAPPHGDFQIAQPIPEEVWAAFEFLTSDEVLSKNPKYGANIMRK
jgi:hypothetical protein